jgi:thiamine-phosphate pyrophosphorylase
VTLPRLLVLSDDDRGFDLTAQLAAWPEGAGFVERTYGRAPKPSAKRSPKRVRLATCSPRQAREAELDGLHWPPKRLKLRKRSQVVGLIETTSAHSGLEIVKAARLGLTNVLVSAVFPSQSPSAKRPLGPVRLSILCRRFPRIRIFALGGVNRTTIRRLPNARAYGIAFVSYGK